MSDNQKCGTGDGNGQSVDWVIPTNDHKFLPFSEDVEQKWKGDFYFIQGADPQYGLIDRYILKLETPNWDKEIALTEETVKMINKMTPKPKFFVICGDLCDAFSDATPELREQQELSFKTTFSKLDKDIPLVCVCGNHDCSDQPNYKTIESYRSSFGDDFFSFWAGGIFFIVINTQYYFDATSSVQDLFKEHQDWLDKQLEHYQAHRQISDETIGPIVFQHVPWFLDDPLDKTPNYFIVPYEIRIKMVEKLINAGVKYVFCGHLHRNAEGSYKDLNVIVTTAIGGQLGNDKSGIRVVKVHSNRIEHQYYAIEDIPNKININSCV